MQIAIDQQEWHKYLKESKNVFHKWGDYIYIADICQACSEPVKYLSLTSTVNSGLIETSTRIYTHTCNYSLVLINGTHKWYSHQREFY